MSLPEPEGRPSKRVKMDSAKTPGATSSEKARQEKSKYSNQARGKSKYRSQATFKASGIHNDDIGIFVTSDKGQEKKCLQELSDLLGEFFDEDSDAPRSGHAKDTAPTGLEKEKEEAIAADIEADISAELDSLRPQASSSTDAALSKLSLVTLDIPCVSFVRFPTRTGVDPVQVVRKLCLNASDKEASGPRSRYIKRLTPVSLIRKTLNDGLVELCNQILPNHFRIELDAEESEPDGMPGVSPCKFAIRPTIRNNNKLNRDEVIRIVADNITTLGQDKHKVDLKGYDKLVLVDVYRNVVGMSVVGSDYETLKRFNLAELHASHLDQEIDDQDPQNNGT